MRHKLGIAVLVLLLLQACGTPTDNTTAGRATQPTAATVPTTETLSLPTMNATNNEQPTAAGDPTTAAPSLATGNAAGNEQQAGKQYSAAPEMQIDPNKTYTATIETTKGTMKAELYAKEAPTTVNNFVFLARDNFYQNVKFHRLIKGFMAQTGDPEGTGMGGPGYTIPDEISPNLRHDERGILSMAKTAAPDTGGSQFFITDVPTPHLDGKHAVFGKVTEGLDVLTAILDTPVSGPEGSTPTEDVRIVNITIQES